MNKLWVGIEMFEKAIMAGGWLFSLDIRFFFSYKILIVLFLKTNTGFFTVWNVSHLLGRKGVFKKIQLIYFIVGLG